MPSVRSATERAGTAADEARRWTAERDDAVRQARGEGASLGELAAATGLSRSAIAKIEKRA